MRIISDKKDYYDSVQALGQDMSLQYVRYEESIGLDHWSFPFRPPIPWMQNKKLSANQYVIGFCGNTYPIIEYFPPYTQEEMGKKPQGIMCYTTKDVDAVMQKYLKKKDYAIFEQTLKQYEDFFKKSNNVPEYDNQNCPIWVAANYSTTVPYNQLDKRSVGEFIRNPILRRFDFAKIKDPYTAFQEIRMWLSNLAAPEKPIPELSNEDLAWSKGHGDKYSFRKAPTKKK